MVARPHPLRHPQRAAFLHNENHMQTATDSAALDACASDAVAPFLQPSNGESVAYANPTIRVVDAIMGAGKSTWAFHYMTEERRLDIVDQFNDGGPGDRRFLYVTPFLDEIRRAREACPELEFHEPEAMRNGVKYFEFEHLLRREYNIATTHVLFTKLRQEAYQLLRERNYTLVIDEALECCKPFGISKDDRRLLVRDGLVSIDSKTNRLVWNDPADGKYRGEFETVRNLCLNGNLVALLPDGKGSLEDASLIVWAFPAQFLSCFGDVLILTYMWSGSPMKAYLAAAGLDVEMLTLDKSRELIPWTQGNERAIKETIRPLVTVYEGPLNAIGYRPTEKTNKRGRAPASPLTKTWFDKAAKVDGKPDLTKLRNAVGNFFRHHAGTPSKVNAWATFKDRREDLEGPRYGRDDNWIPLGIRATNKFKDKRSLAYLANRYGDPDIHRFFAARGVTLSDDVMALSELVQWVWRSTIRDGHPIKVFIPSARMRWLFKRWLAADDVVTFIRELEKPRLPELGPQNLANAELTH